MSLQTVLALVYLVAGIAFAAHLWDVYAKVCARHDESPNAWAFLLLALAIPLWPVILLFIILVSSRMESGE